MVKKILVLLCSVFLFSVFSFRVEAAVGVSQKAAASEEKVSQYLETTVDTFLRIRSGPGTNYGIIRKIPSGVVLKVKKRVEISRDEVWYEVDINKSELRYPERVAGDWYFAARYGGEDYAVSTFIHEKLLTVYPHTTDRDKEIKIFLSEMRIRAYEKGIEVFSGPISSGKSVDKNGNPTDKYKTPVGKFKVYKKVISRYMQGPLPGDDEEYDLPGVAWAMYFTPAGNVIHAAYWNQLIGKAN
ncbi:MAG: L,D-transpeptidase family protein, partial [Candidatus Paceibacterota bacterium]